MRPLLVVLAALLPGCSLFLPSTSDPIACTMEFRAVTVEVVDDAGAPVAGLTPAVRDLRTGDVLAVGGDPDAYGEGRYVVVTDAHRGQLSEGGDRLLFQATGGGHVAEAEFVVSADPCHIQKVSGPDRVVATPSGD